MEKEGFLKQWWKAWVIKWDIVKIKSFYHEYQDKYLMWM
jgi:hypothetical protein